MTRLVQLTRRSSADSGYETDIERGMDFSAPDKLNAMAYNQILWKGVMGSRPYPTARDGQDLRRGRRELLGKYGMGSV